MLFNNDWDNHLSKIVESEYFKTLIEKVKEEYSLYSILPKYEDIFNAFKFTSFKNVSLVIIGQDPYPTKGVPHGLAFSSKSEDIPSSLKNIYKELSSDLGVENTSPNLTKWAREGVLLLNSTLTVREGEAGSHNYLNWQKFTNYVISYISENKENIVFILWGNLAKDKSELIDKDKHLIIKSPHPSPLSAYRGFFGSKPFSKANEHLKSKNKKVIDFSIT